MLRRLGTGFAKASFSKQCTRSLAVLNVNRAEDGGHWTTNLRAAAAVIGLLATAQLSYSERDTNGVVYEKGSAITNWSATHTCSPSRQFEPKSAQEVCRVLEQHHATKTRIRPIGTALSPNGIAMSNGDVLSVAALDYVEVDKERMLVTVGAGARVADVLKELGKYDLTLENFSSIQEQQMGGWTQVAAHGTGCTLPTVEEMIVRMKLATPTEGLMTLSDASNPRLFRMAKAGLGSLGVVTELTLRCIPKHKLLEYTFTTPLSAVKDKHSDRLTHFRHVRYMWFPYTSKVCVVVSNPTGAADERVPEDDGRARAEKELLVSAGNGKEHKTSTRAPTDALCELLLSLQPSLDAKTVRAMSFSQLRDLLLGVAPLDTALVKRINAAEAEFWERSAGFRADDSTNILGFDCGGAQWVMEVAFPIGSLAEQSGKDLLFMQKLLQLVEKHQLPAPCPLEQRWTARSTSPMSPAYSTNPAEVFSWVGIIMYLPPNQSDAQRQEITEKFRQYVKLMRPLCEEFGAQYHWAKIEAPARDSDAARAAYPEEVRALQAQLGKKYPVKEFNLYRRALDPHGILSNELIDTLFGSTNP